MQDSANGITGFEPVSRAVPLATAMFPSIDATTCFVGEPSSLTESQKMNEEYSTLLNFIVACDLTLCLADRHDLPDTGNP
jgi:hypothetical protein